MTRTAVFGLAALLIAAGVAWWSLSAYRSVQQQKAVGALVGDTSRRLEAALALDTEPTSAGNPQTVVRLDEHAQEVDRHVIELRDLGESPNRALAAAADDYLLTVRQILRQEAASTRYRLQVSISEAALREHMRAAGRRSGAWVDQAIRAKERLERNYFDYRVSTEALDRQLASYPSARKALAAQFGAPLLGAEAVEAARKRTAANYKSIAASVEQARQLAAVR